MSLSVSLKTAPAQEKPKQKEQLGWLEKTLAGIAGSIEQAVFTEEHSRKDGWLQRVDPRAKLGTFIGVVLAASFSGSLWALAFFYLLTLAAAWFSRVPFDFL